ncbi:MAG: hypothetical protein JNL58_09630 [Planctomyces sp.]|nr:hypothetical protein [Planctomyces sp.]
MSTRLQQSSINRNRRRKTKRGEQTLLAASEFLEDRMLLAAFSWNTDSDGAWENPANWTGGTGIPGSTDTVIIDRGAANPTITVSSNVTVTSLVTTENIVLASGRLAATTSIQINGGELRWDAGTLQANNTTGITLSAGASIELAGSSAKTLTGVLHNSGTVTVTGTGTMSGGRVENETSGVWDFQADAGFGAVSPTTFNNRGTLRKSAGTGQSLLGASSASRINHLGGTVEVESGTLTLAPAGTGINSSPSTGATFIVDSGATLRLNNGTGTLFYSGTYTGTGDGRIELSGGTLDARSTGGVTLNFQPGLFHWTGGTLFTAGVTGDSLTNLGHMSWSGNGSRSLQGQSFRNLGTVVQTESGQSLFNSTGLGTYFHNEPGAVFVHQGTGSLVGGTMFNNSVVRKSGGDAEFNTKLNMLAGSRLEATSGRFLLSRGGDISSSTFHVTGNAIVELNRAAGTPDFRLLDGTTLTGDGNGRVELSGGRLDSAGNNGRLNFADGLFHWTGGDLVREVTNVGQMQVSGTGQKTILNKLTNQGSIIQSTGSSIEVRSLGILNNVGAVFEMQGDAILTGPAVTGGRMSNAGTLRKTGAGVASIRNNGISLSHQGGRVEVLQGDLVARHSTSAGSTGGHFVVAAGSEFEIAEQFEATGRFTGEGSGLIKATGHIRGTDRSLTFDFPEGLFQLSTTGPFSSAGTINNVGFLTMHNLTEPILIGATLINRGTIAQTAGTNVRLGNFSNTLNYGTWEIEGDNTIELVQFDGLAADLTNFGTIRKTNAGTTELVVSGGSQEMFSNVGTVDVTDGGTFEIAAESLQQYNEITSSLLGGTWRVGPGSELRLLGDTGDPVQIIRSDANIILDGPGSTFSSIDRFWQNGGHLELRNGRDFNTTGNLGGNQLVNGINVDRVQLADTQLTFSNRMVGIAVDPATGDTFTHNRNEQLNGTHIFRRFSRDGAFLGTIPQPGGAIGTSGLDVITQSFNVGGTIVPAGTLLFLRAESQPATLYAIDPDNGTVLASVNLFDVFTNQVGIAHHPGRGSVYLLQLGGTIREIDAVQGTVLQTFSVTPSGSPAFTLTNGGIDVIGASGDLLIVGNGQEQLRQMTANGQYLRDISLANTGTIMRDFSDLSVNDVTGEILISTEQGYFYRFGGIEEGIQGQITVGRQSELNVNGNYTQTGQARFEFAGTSASGNFGRITVGGTASLAGSADLQLVDGFVPAAGDVYNVLSFPSRTGSLSFQGEQDRLLPELTSTQLRVITRDGLADLAVTAVNVPSTGVASQNVTISYTVNNLSAGATLSSEWTDSVYLSSDGQLSANDLLIGRVTHSGVVSGNGTYTESLTASLPGVLPGEYFVIVAADSRGLSPDAARPNNVAASVQKITVDIPVLTPGVSFPGNISAGEELYFRADLSTDLTPIIRAILATPGAVEIFVSQAEFPTRSKHDHYAFSPSDQSLSITQEAGQTGTFYVLLRGTPTAGSGVNFNLIATDSGFGITLVNPSRGANAGRVSTQIRGVAFTPETEFELVAGNGTKIAAITTRLVNSQSAWVTFDLNGAAVGLYDIRAVDQGNEAVLDDVYEVFAGVEGRISLSFSAPAHIRAPRWGEAIITYENVGDTDIVAPILLFYTDDGEVQVPGQSTFSTGSVELIAINPNGPSDVLPPGARGEIRMPFRPVNLSAGTMVNYSLQVAGAPEINWPAGQPELDWDVLRDDLKPAAVNPAAWQAIFDNFKLSVGNTFESFQRQMALNAGYLSSIGQPTVDVGRLMAWEFEKAGNFGEIESKYTLGAMGQAVFPALDSRAMIDGDRNVTLTFGSEIRGYVVSNGNYRPAGSNGSGVVTIDQDNNVTLIDNDGTRSRYRGSDGRLISFSDPKTGETTITRDGNGQAISINAPNGDQTALQYNLAGLVSQITDPVGRVTSLTYTPEGRIASISDASGTVHYSYVTGSSAAANGSLSTANFADGTSLHYEYNIRGQRTRSALRSTLGQEIVSTFTYSDQMAVTMTDPLGRQMLTEFGPGGEIVKVTDSLNRQTRYRWTPSGQLTSIVDPDGAVGRVQVGSNNQISVAIDPAQNRTTFGYVTTAGTQRLSRITDPTGAATNYQYDAPGNMTQIMYPNGNVRTGLYDSRGNLIVEISAAGQRIDNTYNNKDLLVRRRFADGTSVFNTYDTRRNLVSASMRDAADNDVGTTSFTYDSLDRVLSVTYPNGTSLNFTYDAAGRRTSATDHNGALISYHYDSFGRLAEVLSDSGSGATSVILYQYDSLGRLQTETRGNGASTQYEYDEISRVQRISHRNQTGQLLEEFVHTYDLAGRIIGRESTAGPTDYEYDTSGQLTRVTLPGGRSISYSYDRDGNRTQVNDSGVLTAWSSNGADQYLSVGGVAPVYDGNASLTEFGNAEYQYDLEGRLIQMSDGTRNIQYEYDALGNRIASIENGVRTELLVDPVGYGWLFGEYTGGGGSTVYVQGNGVAARINDGTAQYYHYDLVGNTHLITDEAANVSDTYSYLPFGEQTSRTGSTENPFTYNGRYGITDSGVADTYYMRNRNYTASLGRFLEVDPMETQSGETNLYRFAANDPLSKIDPTGFLFEGITTIVIQNPGSTVQLVVQAGSEAHQAHVAAVAQAQAAAAAEAALAKAAAAETAAARAVANGVQPNPGFKPMKLSPYNSNPSAVSNTGRAMSGSRAVSGSRLLGPASTAATVGWYAGRGIDKATDYMYPEAKDDFRDTLGRLPIGRGLEDKDSPIYSNGGVHDSGFSDFVRKNMQDPLINSVAKRLIAGGEDPVVAIEEARRLVRNYRNEKITKQSEIVRPRDPNNIVGPAGPGADAQGDPDIQRTRFEGFVRPEGVYPYEIHFENKPTATAPAQTVIVTHTIDADLDLNTFQLVAFGFGDTIVNIPAGRTNYYERVDVSQTLNVVVDFEATLNPITRELRVTFTSLDPVTFDSPIDPFAGFLPPNVSTPQGDGFIQFTIAPNSGLTNGSVIDAKARIFFDQEDPIDTPDVSNVIDILAPSSSVSNLPAVMSTTSFQVSWSGNDGTGSGTATYDVFVSESGGPYVIWQDDVSTTSEVFTGLNGRSYRFYSVATDELGNTEGTPAAPDTTTSINLPSGFTSPAATTQSLTPTFEWAPTSGAVSYEIWIANLSTGENPFHLGTSSTNSYTPAEPLGIGRYRVWQRSFNPQGVASAWSPQYTFRINAPTVVHPMDRFYTNPRPVISWDTLPGAVSYELWIDNLTTGQSKFVYEPARTETSWMASSDWPLGVYRIWVRGRDGGNLPTSWFGLREIIISTPPTAVSPLNPDFNRQPEFSWSTVTGASNYEFYLFNVDTGSFTWITDLPGTSWTPSSPLATGNYYWQTLAESSQGRRSLWSPAVRIQIGGRPTLQTPVGNTNATPNFTWTPVGGAASFQLWVDRIGSQSGYLQISGLTQTSFTPATALPVGAYRAWVRAISSTGEISPWSLSQDFTVALNKIELFDLAPELNILTVSLANPMDELPEIDPSGDSSLSQSAETPESQEPELNQSAEIQISVDMQVLKKAFPPVEFFDANAEILTDESLIDAIMGQLAIHGA